MRCYVNVEHTATISVHTEAGNFELCSRTECKRDLRNHIDYLNREEDEEDYMEVRVQRW